VAALPPALLDSGHDLIPIMKIFPAICTNICKVSNLTRHLHRCRVLLGVLSKRINAKGAYSAMVIGFVIGMLRIVLELNKTSLSGILYQFATINFLYFCIMLFLVSIAIMVVVSLLSERPSLEQIKGLTFATTVAEDRMASRAS
jgi:hypothetical protein